MTYYVSSGMLNPTHSLTHFDMGRHSSLPIGKFMHPYSGARCRRGSWAYSSSQDSQVLCAGKSLHTSN